ncbi:hypothetical protein CI109_103375 [Kwoniella shandongensis]|uniref:Elongator complex protein 5 n=1 Tax=Kwoniella shandongensis TaxID=1734106 RepID=A0A5M6BWG5_9TREE|nr:uncharacterized protein CI109_004456 [Kwoniella shandongensis]KAA5527164.1 hypothetical protein CI109_004456 [Kwoniella shandongensis]
MASSRNNEGSGALLDGVLNNGQIPHQPLVVINDNVTFSGLPIFKEMIRRAISRGEEITLVTILNPPETILPPGSSSTTRTTVIDLTNDVPGYTDDESSTKVIKDKILSSYSSGQIFIDALDLLAEDYSPSAVLGMVRNVLEVIKKAKAPSRLVLLLPPTSSLYPHLIPPTFSSTITLLTPHPPQLINHLSKSYLSPVSTSPSPNFWMVLENATKRNLTSELSYRGEEGMELDPSWKTTYNAGVVQVLVRKAVGGATKGISRSLEGLKFSATLPSQLDLVELGELVQLNPLSTPLPTLSSQNNEVGRTAQTHAELDLPFNLNLTDAQRRQRGAVPLPYAHEGEGASGDLIWEDEEETDDEEI